jgi:hypothetical protein
VTFRLAKLHVDQISFEARIVGRNALSSKQIVAFTLRMDQGIVRNRPLIGRIVNLQPNPIATTALTYPGFLD